MEENKRDKLLRAYTKLLSLREQIDKMTTKNVPETSVRKFHNVLDRLEDVGIDVAEYRIPDSEITPIVKSIQTLTFDNRPSGPTYSEEKYVDKSSILTELDAILSYLKAITSEKPKKMGFSTPQD